MEECAGGMGRNAIFRYSPARILDITLSLSGRSLTDPTHGIVFARGPMSIISFITPICWILCIDFCYIFYYCEFVIISPNSRDVIKVLFIYLSVDASHPPSPPTLLVLSSLLPIYDTHPMQH